MIKNLLYKGLHAGIIGNVKQACLALALLLTSTLFTHAQTVTGDTSVCKGETVQYVVSPTGGSYAWTIGGGNIVGNPNNDTVNILWGNAGTGTILVTVTTVGGPVTAALNVTIYAKPAPSVTFAPYPTCPSDPRGQGSPGQGEKVDCIKVCEFATVTYSTSLNAGSTYFWVVNGEIVFTGQGTNSITVTWDSTLTGSVTVIETNQWGCIDSASLCVEKSDRPVALFSTQSSVCLNTPNVFNNLSTGANAYNWDFGDGNTSTAQHPTHAYGNAGTYTVTLIVFNACYCSDTFQATVTVDSLPGPDISCIGSLCAGDSAVYATSIPGCVYQWGVIGGTIIGPSNQQQVNVAWGAGPVGTLWLYVTGCNALCSDTTFAYVPIVASTDTIIGPGKVCSPSCHKYSSTYFAGATYNWNLASSTGGQIVSQDCNEIEICWPAFMQGNDTLTVSYFDPFLNCGGTAKLIIRVRGELTIFGLSPVCINTPANFSVNPFVNCNWNVYPAGPTIINNGTPNISINWNGLSGNFLVTAVPLNPNTICNDSAVRPVTVLPPLPAPDIMGDTIVCPGSTYSYCSSAPGNIKWIVTGGTPSSGNGSCISVTWNNTGPYMIQAVAVMNISPYCTGDTTTQNVYSILPLPAPNIVATGGPCTNNTNTFTCTTLYPTGSLYNWSISPTNAGSIIGGQGGTAVTVEWGNNTGPVTVTLDVTVCNQQISNSTTLTLQPAPTPVVNQIGILCPGVAAQLNVTGGAFTAYQWAGPGNTSTSNPATITQGGIHHVTVTDNIGCTASTQFNAVEQPAPLASISTADYLQYCIGQSISVQLNALTNPGYTFQWSNGPTINPITVNAPGTFWVTVTDQNGCTALSNTLTVSQDSCNGGSGNPCIPNGTVSFNHPTFYGCNPLSFTNTSVNASSFTWNFGDFTTANTVNGTHTYNQAGFYLVTLSGYVPNATGTDSCLLIDTAQVEVPLAPRFKYKLDCLGQIDSFWDISAYTPGNNITTWLWDFGDASTSTVQNPTHIYATGGTYYVQLTVGNGTCTSTIGDSVYIAPLPVAAFTFPASACANSPVLFTDASTPVGALNQWQWSWSDGGSSLNQSPTHTFAPVGNYNIQLIVRDTLGCVDTATATITINSPGLLGPIVAYPDTQVCAGTPVLLVAPFCAGCTYSWSNGGNDDSTTVNMTGIYIVTVTDPNGCAQTKFISIIVHPAPPAIIENNGADEFCVGSFTTLITTPSNNYLYTWISNDTFVNGQTVNQVSVNSFQLGAGTFNYQVAIVDTSTGCTDTSLVYTVIIHPLPVPPTITVIGSNTVCDGDSVMLVGSHPDPTVTLEWSTGEVTDTIYATNNGNYILTATDTNGCESMDTVAVVINPLPETCGFWTGCLDTCSPFMLTAPLASSYQWLLNDSVLPGDTMQMYTAMVSGMYSVILTNSFGCIDTAGPIDLMLHPCDDSLCADLVIDSVGCDSSGQYILNYHVINNSMDTVDELTFVVLPPHLNTVYSPVSVYTTIPPNSSSGPQSITIYNGTVGDTLCFRALIHVLDSMGHETMCCNTDTECVVLPPCPEDTTVIKDSCCYFRFMGDSVWCQQTPVGWQYNVSIHLDACGQLIMQLPDTGTWSQPGPVVVSGPTTITGTLTTLTPQSTLCLTYILYSSTGQGICKDTTICIPLICDPTIAIPECRITLRDTICQGQTTSIMHTGATAGLTFSWTFFGGSPATATGPGPHTVTYNTVGCFPVQLSVSNVVGNSTKCIDTICVVPPPTAAITQSGNTLFAAPAGMYYQWYQGSGMTLLSGQTNQFYSPTVSDLICVVVNNGFGCSDTACTDFIPTGIEEAGFTNIKVYPSPADEWLKVSAVLSGTAGGELKLVSALGAVVYQRTIDNGTADLNINIPMRNLPNGLYVVQLQVGASQFMERIFVQHR